MLTVKEVQNAKPGRHSDGSGLYLNVSPTGKKTWILRHSRDKKVTEASLGSAEFIGLSEARAKAFEFRKSLATGIVTPKRVTFEALARETLLNRLHSFKHPHVVSATYERHLRHASPLMGLDPAAISIDQVAAVLRPIWQSKPQTADRVRSLIEQTLDVAIVRGLRVTPNAARYRGTLSHVLGRRVTLSRGHQRALPYDQVPSLMRRLEAESGVVARALRFTILCALRKGEVLALKWEHVAGDVLTIPASLTKMKREFKVPLSSAALAVIEEQKNANFAFLAEGFVFPSPRRDGQPLAPNVFNELLRRLKVDAAPHGFRSSFRDYAGDCTDFPREVAEAALAHTLGGVEGAYRRGNAFAKRAELMAQWGSFCDGPQHS